MPLHFSCSWLPGPMHPAWPPSGIWKDQNQKSYCRIICHTLSSFQILCSWVLFCCHSRSGHAKPSETKQTVLSFNGGGSYASNPVTFRLFMKRLRMTGDSENVGVWKKWERTRRRMMNCESEQGRQHEPSTRENSTSVRWRHKSAVHTRIHPTFFLRSLVSESINSTQHWLILS